MNPLQTITGLESEEVFELWDNSKRASNLITIFWILTGLTIITLWVGYNELELLERFQLGEYVSEEEANTSDLVQGVLGLVQMVVYIVSVVVFLKWFRRAYGNLHRVGIKHVKHSEATAVWSWFVPILVLFKPVQIMSEIWTKTQEKIKELDSSYYFKRGGLIIGLWWGLFIISNVVGRYVLKSVFKDETIEELIEGSRAVLLSDFIQIPEALMVILIVRQLSQMESKLADEVRRSGGKIILK